MSLRDAPSYETLTLERLRLGLEHRVGAHMLHSMDLSRFEDVLLDGFVYRLTADVLAEKLPPEKVERSKTFSVGFPSSSWQHFKSEHAESWWLGWLVRRRPVRSEEYKRTVTLTVDLQKYRTFPQCNYVFPDSLGPYVQMAVTHDYWSQV